MQRVLAVSQTGGHLVELHRLLPRMFGDDAEVTWVTAETDQTRSLLAGEEDRYVADIDPRDLVALSRALPTALRLVRPGAFAHVVGSGSTALAFLPLAALRGIPAHFVESATRTDGPSVTGRLLDRVPRVRTYTQAEAWAGPRWPYRGTVFEAFEAFDRDDPPRALRRVVVTLGMNPFPFRRLLERLVAILPAEVEVLWQTGHTDAAGLGIEARRTLPARELDEAMRAADVVVAHAGAGSALQALDSGRVPVLVPRREALGEQTDDHQPPLAAELAGRGLAVAAEVEALTLDVLLRAAARGARPTSRPPRFVLDG